MKALAVWLLLGSSAHAAIWYVSASAGSDATGSGLQSSPFLTLQFALSKAMPGDRVLVEDGSYAGGLLTGQGTAGALITIAAIHPGLAILESSNEPLGIGSGSAYLVVDGFEVRNSVANTVHVVNAHDITLSNLYVHDAGLESDVILIEQSQRIVLEGVQAARPGMHVGLPPARDCIELVGVTDSTVGGSFIHDGAGVLIEARGVSQNIVFERNVIGDQHDLGDSPPAVGLGGLSASPLPGAAQYEVSGIVFRNNIVYGAANGAVGVTDAQHVAIANNLLLDVDRVGIEFRAGAGGAHASDDVQVVNTLFVDTRGTMPAPFQRSTDALTNFAASFDVYFNKGALVPPPIGGVPADTTGRLDIDPGVPAAQVFASWDDAVAALKPSASGPAVTPGADSSLAPFEVADDILGLSRGGRRDRGPYGFAVAIDGATTPDLGPGSDGSDGGSAGNPGGGFLPAREGCACSLGAEAASAAGGWLACAGLLLGLFVRRRR